MNKNNSKINKIKKEEKISTNKSGGISNVSKIEIKNKI
jgi:hypothetical protein